MLKGVVEERGECATHSAHVNLPHQDNWGAFGWQLSASVPTDLLIYSIKLCPFQKQRWNRHANLQDSNPVAASFSIFRMNSRLSFLFPPTSEPKQS